MLRYCRSIFVTVILMFFCLEAVAESADPPRLRRSESFFGLHFDFHAGPGDKRIGEDVTEAMVKEVIDKIHPDYIQIDCKGHAGYSSYPTKVGNQAGGFVKDPLPIWRAATARRGVSLFMHYSGVYDGKAVQDHPDWAVVDAKGKISDRYTSVFGPYMDQLMIPQLKELRSVYGVDGVWVDGDCWAVQHDYSDSVLAAFREKTGITDVPKKKSDPHYFEFSEFCRQGFRDYLNHYVDTLHAFDPDVQIASNWAFTSLMPEAVCANVDFISGDYSPRDSFNTARFDARCIRNQGKPWDLMAWSFFHEFKDDGRSTTKSAIQMKQEAAVVLSMGGGFQIYIQQKHDCSVRQWQNDVVAKVAKFCRARQTLCHKAQPVRQVALLYSTPSAYREHTGIFGMWDMNLRVKGILYNLLDSQQSVDIVMEHQLTGRMNDYPLIVVAEWKYLTDSFVKELIDYADNGGSLLIIGPDTAAQFKDYLAVKFIDEPAQTDWYLEQHGFLAQMRNNPTQKVELLPTATMFGKLYHQYEPEGDYHPAASIQTLGKGKIAAVYMNLSKPYLNGKHFIYRDFLAGLVRELFPDPIVEVTGSHFVDVAVNRVNGRLAVNLINTAGPHGEENVMIFDEIPPVGPLNVKIRSDKKPDRVTLEPAGTPLDHQYQNGAITLTVPRLEIHQVILVQ